MGSSFLLVVVACFLLITQPYLLKANKLRFLAECKVNGHMLGKSPKSCNTQNDSECCKNGQRYNTYDCSPPVTRRTQAKMTLNSFTEGADGGGEPACGGFYPDTALVVALSTGWFNHHSRCNKMIRIFANGRSVLAKVVDECDSMHGCDPGHAYQPPCGNNVVDASKAVWKKLGYTKNEDAWGEAEVTWSDA